MENEQEFIDLLHERYYYKDGHLFYKKDVGTKIKKGSKAGSISGCSFHGYIITKINYKTYTVHRLIFAMHNRYFPPLIDHIDRNKINNKIENLREATNSENLINSKLSKKNTSGYKGVRYNKKNKKWTAIICRNYKQSYIGSFDTPEEAHQARVKFLEREFNEKQLQ